VEEPESERLQKLAREDAALVVWWGTSIECVSAIARLAREGRFEPADEETALGLLRRLATAWTEVLPTARVRDAAIRLLRVHALRAADALQLAAALVWVRDAPASSELVTRDERLADAARREGFSLR
jgi:hypothetical protein